MDRKKAAAYVKAKKELEVFMDGITSTPSWATPEEAADKVAATIQFLNVNFKRPQVWQQMGRDTTGEGDGGVCCEIAYGDESVGMIALEWVFVDAEAAEKEKRPVRRELGYKVGGFVV